MCGRTNQVTHECLGQNLSLPSFGWKDEPSHNKCLGAKFNSFNLRFEGRTKLPTGALVEVYVLLPLGERTNQATNKCLGAKFMSFYLRVKGRTKSLTSDLIQNLRPSSYWWMDERSHS